MAVKPVPRRGEELSTVLCEGKTADSLFQQIDAFMVTEFDSPLGVDIPNPDMQTYICAEGQLFEAGIKGDPRKVWRVSSCFWGERPPHGYLTTPSS